MPVSAMIPPADSRDARDEALRRSYRSRRWSYCSINTPVVAQFFNDAENHIQGCFHKEFRGDRSKKGYKRVFGVITVNLAYHDPGDPFDNYQLLLHELAHNTLQSNDHLDKLFYDYGSPTWGRAGNPHAGSAAAVRHRSE